MIAHILGKQSVYSDKDRDGAKVYLPWVPGTSDNAPITVNVDQGDIDADGVGDAIDTDPATAGTALSRYNGSGVASAVADVTLRSAMEPTGSGQTPGGNQIAQSTGVVGDQAFKIVIVQNSVSQITNNGVTGGRSIAFVRNPNLAAAAYVLRGSRSNLATVQLIGYDVYRGGVKSTVANRYNLNSSLAQLSMIAYVSNSQNGDTTKGITAGLVPSSFKLIDRLSAADGSVLISLAGPAASTAAGVGTGICRWTTVFNIQYL